MDLDQVIVEAMSPETALHHLLGQMCVFELYFDYPV